ncbi:HD-GYP domain-containing protein [Neomoorella humiferrea]|uniref:Cyclic di-GMP phosphodiesterase response regulator RpfG n=1 Tax=Neomoorella humiferrea TaxID=676965 RepID=A0A2T0ALQ6_9FIRM|nr:HD-GYP domain-containing protein [Moorella humiferrea]PRR69665.1 Cyclic di-GMP phosphodiesterase response regulator RpfG [Moorella humiferrea]
MGKGQGLYSEGIANKWAINNLIFTSPAAKMLLRSAAVLSLLAVTMLNNHARSLSYQIVLDFLYLGPVTVAAWNSLLEGLTFALIAVCLRMITNPLAFSAMRASDYIDFLVVMVFYLIVPVTIELLRRLARQRQQLRRNLQLTTEALLEALQLRDQYTGRHSRQVARYARWIAASLGLSPHFQEYLYLAGLLHDIGKIGVDDACLNKPGALTPEEWQAIRRHPVLGYRIIKKVTGNQQIIARAVLYHHERYDGRGYPRGLKGTAIPLEARILSVADCFDAMTTDRVYRQAMAPYEAVEELRRCAGSQFDPEIVDVFCRILAENALIHPREEEKEVNSL